MMSPSCVGTSLNLSRSKSLCHFGLGKLQRVLILACDDESPWADEASYNSPEGANDRKHLRKGLGLASAKSTLRLDYFLERFVFPAS